MRKIINPAIIGVMTMAILLAMTAPGMAQDKKANSDMTETTMSKAQELLAKADGVFKSREYEKSRGIYQQALAEANGNKSDQTEALSMIARTYLILEDKETGHEWLEMAQKIATPDEPLGWSRFLGVKGRFLWQDDKLDEATAMFKEMYEYCAQHKLHDRAIDAAHMVAITGNHELQVEWGLKGIKEAEAGNVTGWLGPLWNNLGATYEEMKEYEKSLEAYLKAHEYHHKYSDELSAVISDWAVGHAYVNVENYDEAEKWLTPVLAKFEEMENGEFIGFTCKELGEVAFARGDTDTAHKHFVRAEKLLKEAGMDKWDAYGYQKLVDKISECEGHK
jgi:tetratricopeptide (TPR) repeat protein